MGADRASSPDRPPTGPLRRLAWARAVAADSGLHASSFRVAMLVADAYDDQAGRFATGRARIARDLGIATSTVQRAIDQLAGHGWLRLVQGPSRGKNATAYDLGFRAQPTRLDGSVEPSATDSPGQVGSPSANRPMAEAQPTDPSTPTDRSAAPNRPIQAPQPTDPGESLSERSERSERGSDARAPASEPPPPGSEVGDEPEAADNPEAWRWDGFTDSERAHLQAIAALGALLANPTTGEDLRREWLDRTRGLSRDLVANVLGAGGRGFPSSFDKASKPFATVIDQERRLHAEHLLARDAARSVRSTRSRDPVADQLGRFRAAAALTMAIQTEGGEAEIANAAPSIRAAFARLVDPNLMAHRSSEDIEILRAWWGAVRAPPAPARQLSPATEATT